MLQTFLAWFSASLYTFSSAPQVIENYRKQSTKGLSSMLVLFGTIGNVSKLSYAYLCNLPIADKLLRPITVLLSLMLMSQLYYYSSSAAVRRTIIATYVAVYCGLLAVISCSIWYPYEVGIVLGWISSSVFLIYQIPQVIKNFQTRSVEGFSFFYPTMLFLGAVTELLVAYLYHLPAPSWFNAIRGIALYCVYTYQFSLYRK